MSNISNDPYLADMQERLFILATVAVPLIAQNIETLTLNELEVVNDSIIDLGYLAIKLDEVMALEELLAKE